MNILCPILGLNVLVIFFFKREWLFQLRPFLILLGINCMLFALSSILIARAIGDRNLVTMLKISLLYQVCIYILLLIFRTLYRRDPVDTFWTSDTKLFRDGIFNFMCIMALVAVVLILY